MYVLNLVLNSNFVQGQKKSHWWLGTNDVQNSQKKKKKKKVPVLGLRRNTTPRIIK
jgi:hypothetical protein